MNDMIVKNISKILIPFIQLYALFIIINGHISPGGGFAGGAILGSSMVLYTIVYGIEKSEEKLPHSVASKIEGSSILIFIGIGLFSLLLGNEFLTNRGSNFNMGTFGNIISGGFIPYITILIGIKVGSTITTLFQMIIEE